ncbi:hypothetical protein OMK64_17130 [Cellulomonas fimi]|uniref:hypothetical protein n=1 Tax=Cellulomonas fimi TaxID=1708 RepID=UPI00234C4AFB|nr:hypothetical protein [Cellulomonas fimi]MDC7123255.1 hypothetical protein [Cellulomonas fimi]
MPTVSHVEVRGPQGDGPGATAETAAPSAGRARWSRWTGPRTRDVVAYVAAVLGALLGAAWALRLWAADLHVPFTYWGDAVAVSAHVKTVLETGWYEYQPLLGAPAGQRYHDYPTADNAHLAIMRVLGALVGGDWAVTLNTYYVLGFPLAALTAMVFLRKVGVTRVLSVMAAVLFALAPYHLFRGEAHLWLASYYPVPLGLLLVLRVVRGEPLWGPRDGDGPAWRRWLLGPAAATTGIAVLLGSAQSYYTAFTLVLLGVAGVAAWVHRRSWRRLVGAAAAGVALVVVVVLNMLPDILWARQHGSNAAAFVRAAPEAEIYALKLTSLLLPVPNHPVPLLADVRAHYDGSYPLGGEQPALGVVGAVGLVLLLAAAVLHLLRPAESRVALTGPARAGVELAGLAVVSLLFASVGGFSSLISFLTPAIRGWNRMSIVLALLSLAAVGLALDAGRRRLERRNALVATGAAVVVAGVLVVGGVYDQTSTVYRPDHASVQAAFAADEAWVGEVEDLVGEGAMVAQLPYMAFPESPAVNGVFDADRLRPYLHSETLRWTAGGVKGRATADWSSLLDPADAPATSVALAASDAAAVVIDRAALGPEADAVSQTWRSTVGEPAVQGVDGRFEVYDLRPLRAELIARDGQEEVDAAAERVVTPTMAYPGEGVDVHLTGESDVTWIAADGVLPVVLDNARDTTARVRATFAVPATGAPVVLAWPDGTRETLAPGSAVTTTLEVEPGRTTVTATADGAPAALTKVTVSVVDRPVLEPPTR